jgi:hypothetical protein
MNEPVRRPLRDHTALAGHAGPDVLATNLLMH